MAVDNVAGGAFIFSAAAIGVAAKDLPAFGLSMDKIVIVAGFAIAGAVARAFLDAKAARDAALEAGTPHAELPRVDLVSLAYAILGAPFVGTIAYAGIEWAGISTDYAIATTIMGFGYLGRDGINIVTSAVSALLKARLGAKE